MLRFFLDRMIHAILLRLIAVRRTLTLLFAVSYSLTILWNLDATVYSCLKRSFEVWMLKTGFSCFFLLKTLACCFADTARIDYSKNYFCFWIYQNRRVALIFIKQPYSNVSDCIICFNFQLDISDEGSRVVYGYDSSDAAHLLNDTA